MNRVKKMIVGIALIAVASICLAQGGTLVSGGSADAQIAAIWRAIQALQGASPASAPVCSSISPTSGSPGSSVTVIGSYIGAPISVAFTSGQLASYQSLSSTTLTTTVPAGAATGPIIISTSISPPAVCPSFTVQVPVSPPVITSFYATPSQIAVGQSSSLGWIVSGATSLSINQ